MSETISLHDARAKEAQNPRPETEQESITRLAALSPFEYDKCRMAEAEKLGVRVPTLDSEIAKIRATYSVKKEDGDLFPNVEPWSEPVDPEILLDDIQKTVRFYIVCNTETAVAVTLWIAFTWLIDHVKVAPIAMITAPEKRCGKSQLLSLIGKLSSRPLLASNISPAAIYRVIEAHSPTLLIDEADAFLKDNEEARGIINSGHTRCTAHVIRVVGEMHEPKQFSTWGAKAISGIGKLSDTLMDRSVILELRRKLPHEKVERLRHAEELQFDILKRRLARFAMDAGYIIETAKPHLPDALNDRAQDNWEPLLAIADVAGGHWPQTSRNTALKISGAENDAPSLSIELLQDIQEIILDKFQWNENIPSKILLEELNADDLKPWATYNRGQPMSPRQLARRLGEYHIKPQNLCIGNARPKGYRKEQFADVFARYLTLSSPYTPQISATPLQNSHKTEPEPNFMIADQTLRSASSNQSATLKPSENKACSGVADKTHSIVEDIVVF